MGSTRWFFALTLLFLPVAAFGQSAEVTADADVTALALKLLDAAFTKDWVTVVGLGLLAVSWASRYLTSKESWSWLHSKAWTVWSSTGLFAVSAVSKVILSHGFNARTIVSSLVLAVLNAGLLNNPTITGTVVKAAPVLLLGLSLTGCVPRIVREEAPYRAELDLTEQFALQPAARLAVRVQRECTCTPEKTFSEPSCEADAKLALVVQTRVPYHKAMALYNAGLTKDRPPVEAPAVPSPSSLCK